MKGKAKEQFEKWFNTHHVYEHFGLATFKELPESFQWGVIQDWADSLGLEIETGLYWNCETEYYQGFRWFVGDCNDRDEDAEFSISKTRQEARNAAIEKLNELTKPKMSKIKFWYDKDSLDKASEAVDKELSNTFIIEDETDETDKKVN